MKISYRIVLTYSIPLIFQHPYFILCLSMIKISFQINHLEQKIFRRKKTSRLKTSSSKLVSLLSHLMWCKVPLPTDVQSNHTQHFKFQVIARVINFAFKKKSNIITRFRKPSFYEFLKN